MRNCLPRFCQAITITVRCEVTMMMRTLSMLLISAFACVDAARAGQASAMSDERALIALVEAWTAARSANDAEAMRPLFTEKVDRVALPGARLESTTREELLTYFAEGFKGAAKGTRAKSSAIRPVLLSSDAGLVDHTYDMYGADGSKIGVGYTTFVVLRVGDTWRIAALRYISAWPSAQPPRPTADR
jgi:uncharacterized protein (TIGR02246 family)